MSEQSEKVYSFHFEREPKGGIRSGANDGRLHQFTGLTAAESVVREAIQNSIDAKREDTDKVTVEFEIRDVHTHEIPGIEELRHAANSAWSLNRDNAGSEGLKSASDALSGQTMRVLRIGDYGTTGLLGDESESDYGKPSPLVALILGDGLSSKKEGEGGSFGIGATAMLRASEARTVAYLTRREDGSTVFAARALLARHLDQEGGLRRKDGIFRAESGNFQRDIESFGPFGPRSEPGTDIFVYGYQDEALLEGLHEAVITNFMVAVHFDRLAIRIITPNHTEEITSSNLGKLIAQSPPGDKYWHEFYELLVSTDPIVEDIPGLGEVKLYLSARDDKKFGVQLMRKPLMLVRNFKPRGLSISYIGLFICENDVGNAVLQSMEPPSHSDWERTGSRGNATIRNSVDRFIKDQIRELMPPFESEEVDPEGLKELLPQQADPSTPESIAKAIVGGGYRSSPTIHEGHEHAAVGTEITNVRVERSKTLPEAPVHSSAISNSDGDQTVQRGEHSEVPGPSPDTPSSDKTIPDSGEAGDGKSQIASNVIQWKSFNPFGSDETVVVIKALEDAQGDITFSAVGADRKYDIDIAHATLTTSSGELDLEHNGGTVKNLTLIKDELTTIKLWFHTRSAYVLEVSGD